MDNRKPLTYTPITMITGEPRTGKTNTAVARVVDAREKDPSTRIFANFNLYGLKYVHADLATIVEYLNTDLLKNGYIIIDEAYIGLDARQTASLLDQVLTYLTLQAGKRGIHLIIIFHHTRIAEWRVRWLASEIIECSYNEKKRQVTLHIKDRRQRPTREKVITYDAWPYWKYYDTEEVMPIPESKLAKALMTAR